MRLLVVPLVLSLSHLVLGQCECGYTAHDPNDNETYWVFNDILETDFTLSQNIALDTAWIRQEYNVTAEDGRGTHGKAFQSDNVHTVPGEDGKEASLELVVGSNLLAGAVPAAEMDSTREDLHWGSYRAGIKMTSVSGTCGAFFWYFNDTQEIDIEFLSRDLDTDSEEFPVNLVIQSPMSAEAGYDASQTEGYQQVDLGFDPTDGFHEYRFDYVPGHVYFYADSVLIGEVQGEAVPSAGGHLILQHWSNGNELWSGGPPAEDASLAFSYVKAYFNSSDERRQYDLDRQCEGALELGNGTRTCAIPDWDAKDADDGGLYFTRGGELPEETDGNDASTSDTDRDKEGDDEDEDSWARSPRPQAMMCAVSVLMAGTLALGL